MPEAGLRRCFRCGNVWTPRRLRVKVCPLCKSHLWHTPRLTSIPEFDPANRAWRSVVIRNRATILEIAGRHRAHNVRVFGSVRHGTSRRGSDLDLLVTFESTATLLDQIELQHELADRLGRPVDVVSDRSLFWLTRAQILAEAQPV